jgi:hypothetical protein
MDEEFRIALEIIRLFFSTARWAPPRTAVSRLKYMSLLMEADPSNCDMRCCTTSLLSSLPKYISEEMLLEPAKRALAAHRSGAYKEQESRMG